MTGGLYIPALCAWSWLTAGLLELDSALLDFKKNLERLRLVLISSVVWCDFFCA